MPANQELRERIRAAIAGERDHLVEVSETIRLNPELGFEEYIASNLLADHLREEGLEVQKPYCGLETAFRATLDSGKPGPRVMVLAEYDALKGLGHGCGHNLIGASGLATAIGMKAVIEEVGGTFDVLGTPAEEGGAGKLIELEQGAFEGVDAVMMIHHGCNVSGAPTEWPVGTNLAVSGFTFEFTGKPAHSAADPYNGVNALNAVIQLFTGIDALRQHIRMESRIHGIITHGGEAANVVPKFAAARISVRADSRDYLHELLEKVANIGKGAALATGCEVNIQQGQEIYDFRPSYVIGQVFQDNLKEAGLQIPVAREGRTMASNDFGNVSYVVPSVSAFFAISNDPISHHSQDVVDAAGSEFGYDQFIKASTAMAFTVLDLMTNPDLVARAWDAHNNWEALYVK